jgi:hypothetical protein
MSKSSNSQQSNLDIFLSEIWSKRGEGLPAFEIDWNKPIRHQDLLYLLNRRYPFLQMVNTDPDFFGEYETKLVTAPNRWVIHDYGDAMSSSPGKYLFGPGSPEVDEEDEGGNKGSGTMIQQAFDTAQTMIALAIEKQWPGVQIVAGTPIMQWSAWMAAQDHQFPIEGYEPSEQDQLKRKRVQSVLTQYGKDIRNLLSPRK